MVDQRSGRVLGQDPHVGEAGVDRVREREVDDPILAAERHARLGPDLGEDGQPLPFATGEDQRQHRGRHAPILHAWRAGHAESAQLPLLEERRSARRARRQPPAPIDATPRTVGSAKTGIRMPVLGAHPRRPRGRTGAGLRGAAVLSAARGLGEAEEAARERESTRFARGGRGRGPHFPADRRRKPTVAVERGDASQTLSGPGCPSAGAALRPELAVHEAIGPALRGMTKYAGRRGSCCTSFTMSKQPSACTLSGGGTVPSRNGSVIVGPQARGRHAAEAADLAFTTPSGWLEVSGRPGSGRSSPMGRSARDS